MLPSTQVRELVRHWIPNGADNVSARLDGGDLNDVYRVDSGGSAYALRLYNPGATPQMVEVELEVVSRFSECLPEVHAPIATRDGELLVLLGQQVAVLFPFIDGHRPDKGTPAHRDTGAGLLARLHRTALGLGLDCRRPEYPALAELDWTQNRWWAWPEIQKYLRDASEQETEGVDREWLCDALADALDEIPEALATLAAMDLPRLQVHGDYYPGNMRMRRDRVVGLFDWDETRVDWRAWEVARAIWEFCERPEHRLDVHAARRFIDTYRAGGGVVTAAELAVLVTLMRVDILWGVLYSLGEFQREVSRMRGVPVGWQYQAGQLVALANLKSSAIC